ncbi:hypothetical protein MMYC01_202048 [Madurella mycetomatis]|uniref:Clr5 domain-containing protein n=1 Tax=Madurella mycetomatis TaxID=100816 RepID=A0A175WDT7_9PEZI|nr:hypothetical protein MMYC01_202048 [Madurella mycetomatis]
MFSENRAAAPGWPMLSNTPCSTSNAALTPGSVPTDAADRASSPDLNSRTLQGPSTKEWARHRETIISLYRQYPLKRVSEIMRRYHGFSASKRMYDKRFREWNVFKNVNGEERLRVARRAQEDRASMVNTGTKGNIDQDDLRRTIRCARSIKQVAKKPQTKSLPVSPNAACELPSRSERSSISIPDLLKDQENTQSTAVPASPGPGISTHKALSSSSSNPSNTPVSSPGSADEHTQDGSEARSSSGSPGPGLATYKAQLQNLARSPPPPIPSDSSTHTIGIITLKLQQYLDWQLENIPEGILPDDYLGRRYSDASERYWSTIKDAIYLIKISDGSMEDLEHRPDRRAWPAFAEAGCLAAEAMMSHPFDFLRNLFATLSPANTSVRPELRGILLQFLGSEAQSSLSPNHPITLICQELQGDGDCQEVSRRSLQCMLDLFNNRLRRSRAVTFRLLDSLATLLRRNGEFHAAMDIIVELLKSCRQAFGPASDEARTVENELAHFYMSIDECDLALDHCMSVVTRQPVVSSEGTTVFYQDGISAHTMEDIAEIFQRRGDMEQCVTWLERAASIALSVWGPRSIATGHIIDKMTGLQRQFGKDLLRSAMLWEAALV